MAPVDVADLGESHAEATDRYIAFNCQKDVFKDKRVRQALNYATDKESIRVVCYGGNTSEKMDSVVPSTLPGHTADLVQYDYDVEKAKALLTEAGYGDGMEVEFMYLANSTNNMLAELLQQMWSQVGVTIEGKNSHPDDCAGYGYFFWRCSRDNAYCGHGYAGQRIIVLPEQDACIAVTAHEFNSGAVMDCIWNRIVEQL